VRLSTSYFTQLCVIVTANDYLRVFSFYKKHTFYCQTWMGIGRTFSSGWTNNGFFQVVTKSRRVIRGDFRGICPIVILKFAETFKE